MNAVAHVVYLHGFASSPASSKATRFGQELRVRGVGFDCPDLNEPAFETLTVTRMLQQGSAAIAPARAPVALIGSSLGGFVAAHAAAGDRTGRVDRLILLAPAVDFGGNRLRQLGEHGIEEWKRSGRLRVFHYASESEKDIGYQLYADAAAYDAFSLELTQPILVFQGRHDTSVDPAAVERWASTRPNVDLRMLDDDHQLTSSLDLIWQASKGFLGLTESAPRA